jgi:hypothetical protein
VWKKMTGNRSGQTEPDSDLPGFKNVYGNKPDKPSPGIEAKPRLIPVDRKQMRIVPIDVERHDPI